MCTNGKMFNSLKEKIDFYQNLIDSADLDRLNVVYSVGCCYLLSVNLLMYFLLCFHNEVKSSAVHFSDQNWISLSGNFFSLFWLQVCLQLGKKAAPVLPVKGTCALTRP